MKKTEKKNVKKTERQAEPVHFVEDLERRQNASAPVTTLAIGEEGPSGW